MGTLSRSNSEEWRYRDAVARIWGRENLGRTVFSDISLEEAFRKLDIRPDVKAKGLRWAHRRSEGADWYFVCPQPNQGFSGDVSFLQSGRAELWNPVSGTITPLATQTDGAYSRIHLELAQGESHFVVFRHDGQTVTVPQWAERESLTPDTPWQLTFPAGWGADESLQLSNLLPWKDLPLSEEGKAFSGTGVYTTTLTLPRKDKACRYVLNLGQVEQIAVVELNGHVCDTLWATPYETDVTRYVRSGRNRITVRVTSAWHNRLVYDAKQPEKDRRTWVISGPSAQSALRPSGLLGPVRLSSQTRK
jgi:hypothetical protein